MVKNSFYCGGERKRIGYFSNVGLCAQAVANDEDCHGQEIYLDYGHTNQYGICHCATNEKCSQNERYQHSDYAVYYFETCSSNQTSFCTSHT